MNRYELEPKFTITNAITAALTRIERARGFLEAATNVREMQWRPSQKIAQGGSDAVIATFELGNTIEFKRWILGFGCHATVLAPKELAEEVRHELKQAHGNYGGG